MKKSSTEIRIAGMHCEACEVLLERRLKKIPGVTHATVNQAKGIALIETNRSVPSSVIAQTINKDGYSVTTGDPWKPLSLKDYGIVAVILLLILSGYWILEHFRILSSIKVSDSMGLGLVFVIGLVAATSTCLAVTGGLLLALAAKQSENNSKAGGKQKFQLSLYFNIGRLISYAAFGALLGWVGSRFTFSAFASGLLTLVAALIMVLLGLQMLRLIPALNRLSFKPPKFIAHRLYDQTGTAYRPWAPFIVGAGTFFLPCGFTQALQFYVLAKGSVLIGATTMFVFALGTLPVLMGLGVLSSFSKGAFHTYFVRIAAIIVIVLGIISLKAGYTLVTLGL